MNDFLSGVVGATVALCVAAIILIAHDNGRVSVATDCDDYGQAKINRTVYECRPLAGGKP